MFSNYIIFILFVYLYIFKLCYFKKIETKKIEYQFNTKYSNII